MLLDNDAKQKYGIENSNVKTNRQKNILIDLLLKKRNSMILFPLQ